MMVAQASPAHLDGIDLFHPLSEEVRARLARQCAWRHFQPHEQIIDRASSSRDVCLIVQGKVRVVNYALSGREITFDDMATGGYLGELSAMDGQARSATVIALEETWVAFMGPGLFMQTVTASPEVAAMVMRRLAGMVRSATERIMDLSTLAAHNRVQAELLRLARLGGVVGNQARIVPVPVHADIASRVSATRETVARVMSDLARLGLVARQGDHLAIADFQRLQAMVEDVRGDGGAGM
jgi:CRP/FNR family transcriptional regulator, cyclic AMP receptor protein